MLLSTIVYGIYVLSHPQICLLSRVQRSVSTAIGTLTVLEGTASASMDLWETVWIAGVRLDFQFCLEA